MSVKWVYDQLCYLLVTQTFPHELILETLKTLRDVSPTVLSSILLPCSLQGGIQTEVSPPYPTCHLEVHSQRPI